MFTNALSANIFPIWSAFKDGVKKREINFSLDKSKINLMAKLVVLIVATIIIPVPAKADIALSPQTKILFDKNSPTTLTTANLSTQISVGRSNHDANTTPNQVIATSTHNDPADLKMVYMSAGKEFNVPWQLIEAVHQVESGKSGSTSKRSSAGATGPMQFMPGTFRAYGVDGNGDGKVDITDVTDSIYTAANYLAKSGADEGRIEEAVFNYNHSTSYVHTVVMIAQEIGYTSKSN